MLEMRSVPIRSFSHVFARSFWAVMGIVHASALMGAWTSFFKGGPDASEFAGCLALSLSMLYFVLKVCGISFLRFRSGKRSWAVVCLLVLLIHADCITPDFSDYLASGYPDLLATTALVGGVYNLPRASSVHRRPTDQSSKVREATTWSVLGVDLDGFLPRCWVLASHLFRLRAPPA